ncbi:hypothetical protein TNCV_4674251 [Trichonephila clavipes]|nr:hypothetical protein TNCV_4674251 [Trichonephila clavipes]
MSIVGLWSGREKKKREIGLARKRAENREGSLGFPGFVKPVFTKDSTRFRCRNSCPAPWPAAQRHFPLQGAIGLRSPSSAIYASSTKLKTQQCNTGAHHVGTG